MKGSIEWVPLHNEITLWEQAADLITDDIMADARAIYKIETGKACSNNAMKICLQRAVYALLTENRNVRNIFKE
jgi:hypothetical protein